MKKVIISAKVEDSAKWERNFRSHTDMFKEANLSRPIELSANDKNEIAMCAEPKDLNKYLELLRQPRTTSAMREDGVKGDTLKGFVLDKEIAV